MSTNTDKSRRRYPRKFTVRAEPVVSQRLYEVAAERGQSVNGIIDFVLARVMQDADLSARILSNDLIAA
jgi:predicted HicB family RNase H-like nuclease